MYYYRSMMDGQDWSFGFFMMLFWLVALILLLYFVMRLLKNHEGAKEEPVGIAKARYAKGEITKEQFEQLRKDLK